MTQSMDNIFITYVNVDHDFLKIWGQQDRTCATYIEKQLLQLVPEFSATSGPNPNSVCKGMFCFAKYADDNYYRARIISDVQCNSVIVSFVDYGNRDYVDLSNIRIQSGVVGGVLSKIVAQAEEFYLARVKAITGGWTKDTVDQIRRDLCYEEFNYRLISHLGNESLIQINYHNEDYANILIRRNLATEISIENQQSLILNFVTQNVKHPSSRTDDKNNGVSRSDFGNINYKHQVAQLEQMSRNENTASGKVYQATSKLHNLIETSHSASISSGHLHGPLQNMNKFVNNQRQRGYHNVQNVNSVQSGASYNHNDLGNCDKNTDAALNSVNTDVIEAIANKLKQQLLKDSLISTIEPIPHNYTTRVLEVGTTHNVYVSCIDDGPWSFSVQVVSDEHELNQLMDDLAAYDLTPIKLPVVLGYPCVAKSKQYGNFCRGVVVNVSLGAVKVYFVDFGNAEDLPVTSLYELPTKFFKTKVLSQKFALNGLQHITFSDRIKKAFIEVVENELLLLQVTSLEGDTLPTCELYIKDRNIKRILNEKVKLVWRWDPVELPKPGIMETVMVTWIESPQKFFVQLTKNAAYIETLRIELAEYDTKGEKFVVEEIKPEIPCICRFTGDDEWYRAIITSVNSKGTATVFYVDFGNTETVNFSMIRKVGNSQFVKEMKTQAIQCCLKGYESGPWNEDVTDALQTYVLEKELRMTVISAEKDRIAVRLWDENLENALSLLQHKSVPQPTPKFPDIPISEECKLRHDKIKSVGMKSREGKIVCSSALAPSEDECNNTRSRGKIMDRNRREIDRKSSNFAEPGSFASRRELSVKKKEPSTERTEPKKSGKYGFRSIDTKRDSTGLSDRSRTGRDIEKNWRSPDSGTNNVNKLRDNVRKSESDKKFKSQSTSNIGMRLKKVADEVRMNYVANSEIFREPLKQENIASSGSTFTRTYVKIDSTEDVIVTYYVNPSEIYIQVLSKKEEFRRMMDDIQNYYASKLPLRGEITKGVPVIAQFKEDEILYRAVVVCASPLTVRYADYGNEEIISKDRLWPMDKKFLQLEIQSLRCSIPGLKPNGSDTWPAPDPEIDKIFECEKYSCTFLNYKDGRYEVDLKVSESGRAVKDELISSGYALLEKGGKESCDKDISLKDLRMDMALMSNEIYNVYISHIVDGQKFFLQITSSVMKDIEKAIAHCIESQQALDINYVDIGQLCLGNDNDKWFRAKIIQKTEFGSSVHCIDYGNKLELTYEQMKRIPDDLANYEPQAIECCFFNASDIIPKDVNDKFRNYVNEPFLAFINEVMEERLKVTLYNLCGTKLEFLENLNNVPSVVQPIGSLPLINREITVHCSHVDSAKEVYLQLSRNTLALEEFNSKMAEFYSKNDNNNNDNNLQMKDIAIVGKLCAAKWDIDDYWYRGRILSVSENLLTVFFLDYGNSAELPLENIRKLDSSFYEQYAFAKKASLNLDQEVERNMNCIKEKIWEFVDGSECIGYFWKERGVLFADLVVNNIEIADWLISECGMKLTLGDIKNELVEKSTAVNIPLESPNGTNTSINNSSAVGVFISHAISPSEFWIHEESVSNELHLFQNQLQKFCSNRLAKKDIYVGDVIGASFTDGLWYRGKITNVDDNVLKVQFIDYGNSMEIDLKEKKVIELTEEFKVPPFASYCSLTGSWKENAAYRFEEIITEHQDPFTLIELGSGIPKIVDLLQNGNSITKQLIKEGFGLSEDIGNIGSENGIVFISHINSPEDFYVQRECDMSTLAEINNILVDADSFKEVRDGKENVIYAAKNQDDDNWYRGKIIRRDINGEIQIHSIDYGISFKASTLKLLPAKLEHIPGMALNCCLPYGCSNDTWSEVACGKFKKYLDIESLRMEVVLQGAQKSMVKLYKESGQSLSEELGDLCEKDARTEVYVTHVNSPHDFYVRNVIDQHFNVVLEHLKLCDNFDELTEIKTGVHCASKYEGSTWRRVEIRKICGDECEVFFLDYGNTTRSSEFKKLPKEIEAIKPLAENCSLNFPVTNIPESIKEEFINLTECGDKIFHALVIKPGDRKIISLMLDGKKLEEVLLYTISESSDIYSIYLDVENQSFVNSGTEQSPDGAELINVGCSVEKYDHSNVEDDIRARNSFMNETDEEKRVKIAIIMTDNTDGFKSDDEKGILDNGSVSTSTVNIPDNQLLEESATSVENPASEETAFSVDPPVDDTVAQTETLSSRRICEEINPLESDYRTADDTVQSDYISNISVQDAKEGDESADVADTGPASLPNVKTVTIGTAFSLIGGNESEVNFSKSNLHDVKAPKSDTRFSEYRQVKEENVPAIAKGISLQEIPLSNNDMHFTLETKVQCSSAPGTPSFPRKKHHV